MIDCCEYCGRDDVILYAWHADVWCVDCIEEHPSLPMSGTLADAPLGRPVSPSYDRPFVWQTPDRQVLNGILQ